MTAITTFSLTSSQTVGPFFAPALLRPDALRNVLVEPETIGERIRIDGRVLDGDGIAVPDAMVEIWQANAQGRYNHPADTGSAPLDPSFLGYGRSGTTEEGYYWFDTIKPGPAPLTAGQQHLQAPHIVVTVFARGLLNHAVTRLYFADDPANATDSVLQCVPAERRGTLLATRESGETTPVYRFDIVLQGTSETAFFNL